MDIIFKIGYYLFSMILGIAKFVAITGLIIWGIVKSIKLVKKNKLVKRKKPLVLSIICIIIATASLVLNMGWIRFCMIFMFIPIIQPILFLMTNLYASHFFDKSPRLRVINVLFIITYLIFWILLPDGGDTGPSYCLFNLIRNDDFAYMAFAVSWIVGIAHIVFFVMQIIQFVKLKKEKTGN